MTAPRISLSELERLHREATPEPWRPSGGVYKGDCNEVVSADANICGLYDGGQTRESINANGKLIAAARNALPALLKVVRAALALVDNKRGGVHNVLEWDLADRALEPFRE